MNEIELGRSLKKDLLYLFMEGIKPVKPDKLIEDHFVVEKDKLIVSDVNAETEKFHLDEFERIFVIGAGKASSVMASEIEKILGDKIDSGVIVTKYGFGTELKIIEQIEAGHPLPDNNGIAAAEKIKMLCNNATEKDLVINLLSGGASSLLPSPAGDINLEEKIQTTKLLLNSGATIGEINTIRKHISTIKGGQLMQFAFPATVISLIISDVIGDDLGIIGSGPTVPDNSTFSDCLNILTKYDLINSVPSSVLQYLTEGDGNRKYETPSSEVPIFTKANNFIIGNNLICLNYIKDTAQNLDYDSKILNKQLSGEAKQVGIEIVSDAIEFLEHGAEVGKKYCLIYGGETTVHIIGKGKGGRNQEMVLSGAVKLSGHKGIAMLSCGSDGNDGPTDAAGAYCDWTTINRGKALNLNAQEYLSNNDSYNFFNQLNDLIITGPTKTNVMDIQIILISKVI
ncbi:D-glycerate 2-kinase [hydrothermal vent metagenome]|uniref:D-glycerate 2-kinase n=1 Tax=hydrothermal vent metagenome TaxID=652676 RepID=A0A3B1C054_9ZZZZ